jgi:hypothetical protein
MKWDVFPEKIFKKKSLIWGKISEYVNAVIRSDPVTGKMPVPQVSPLRGKHYISPILY